MNKFEWSSDLSIGVLEMDNQHKKLINMINDLIENIGSLSKDEVLKSYTALGGAGCFAPGEFCRPLHAPSMVGGMSCGFPQLPPGFRAVFCGCRESREGGGDEAEEAKDFIRVRVVTAPPRPVSTAEGCGRRPGAHSSLSC